MDFKKCEALLAAIDTGSFTKAAEQLHYTPSGISHMMTNLEAELGFPLPVSYTHLTLPTILRV